MSSLPFAADAPISIGRVGLRARDADAVASFYKSVLGLNELRRSDGTIALGVGGREILEIEGSSSLKQGNPRSAGLYHTAFLLPSRTDLGRWLRHAVDNGFRIDGAADHLVSEALYMTDPEGNGVEIYRDRDAGEWAFEGSTIKMANSPLDYQGLLAEATQRDAGWQDAPENTIIGHVHLRVGESKLAEDWWNSQMGFDTMLQYGGAAVFLSTGGYHHHIGANSWESAGAGPREADRTGLSFVELSSHVDDHPRDATDPWGNAVRVVPA